MTKEKIFEEIKDLIKALKSDALKLPKVKKLWLEKKERVSTSMIQLSNTDQRWLNEAYKKWSIEHLGIEQKKDKDYPCI